MAQVRHHESPAHDVRFIVWWYRILLVGAFAVFGALLLSLGLRSPSVGGRVFSGVSLIPTVFILARATRTARIDLTVDGVVIYGLFRTRRMRWSQVRQVSVGAASSATPLPWRAPTFHLDDGTEVVANEVRSLSRESIVDRVVTEARRRQSSRR